MVLALIEEYQTSINGTGVFLPLYLILGMLTLIARLMALVKVFIDRSMFSDVSGMRKDVLYISQVVLLLLFIYIVR